MRFYAVFLMCAFFLGCSAALDSDELGQQTSAQVQCRIVDAIIDHGCGLHGWAALQPNSPGAPRELPLAAVQSDQPIGFEPALVPLGHHVYELEPDQPFLILPDNTTELDTDKLWTVFVGAYDSNGVSVTPQLNITLGGTTINAVYPISALAERGEACAGVFSHEQSFYLRRQSSGQGYQVQVIAPQAAKAFILFDPSFTLATPGSDPLVCESVPATAAPTPTAAPVPTAAPAATAASGLPSCGEASRAYYWGKTIGQSCKQGWGWGWCQVPHPRQFHQADQQAGYLYCTSAADAPVPTYDPTLKVTLGPVRDEGCEVCTLFLDGT